MREILFRGKRIDSGEWVEGYLVCDTKFYGKDDPHVYIVNHEHPSSCFGSDIYIEVDPATVGQFTGLKDMYGKEIWEGDIAQYYGGGWDEEDGPGVIKWDEDSARFILENDGLTVDFDNCWPAEMQVVGNIYDNPELLEGQP